jgi:hypothetical protein
MEKAHYHFSKWAQKKCNEECSQAPSDKVAENKTWESDDKKNTSDRCNRKRRDHHIGLVCSIAAMVCAISSW